MAGKPVTITGQMIANAMGQLSATSRAGTKARGYTGTDILHVTAPSVAAAKIAVGRTGAALARSFHEQGRPMTWAARTVRVKVRGYDKPVNADISDDYPHGLGITVGPRSASEDASRTSGS